MNRLQPIYTEKAECQDCYKCLRQCPVKAIKIENGHASVMADRCIHCGHCVTVCPVGAKQVREERGRVKQLLKRQNQVWVSLAPSYLSEFPQVDKARLVAAIKRLGFAGVSETALGAQEVSAHAATLMQGEPAIHLSTACPAAVRFVERAFPQLVDHFTPLFSPLLAHARLLRKWIGQDISVIFIGPCIAKKGEADAFPALVDAALTFEDLRTWWDEAGIDPQALTPTPGDRFLPQEAQEGRLYPLDGGMIATLEAACPVAQGRFMSFSGLTAVADALRGLGDQVPETPIFLELLACEGGCVNGPMTARTGATVLKRRDVLQGATGNADFPRSPSLDIGHVWTGGAAAPAVMDEAAVDRVLRSMGKPTRRDELNCGACGYDNCRDFAVALLDARAEKTMCVSYMRKLAQNQTNALMKTMPSGVVIVDGALRIVDCNRPFARVCGPECEAVYEADPGLGGAVLSKVFPFADFFEQALKSGLEILDKDVRMGQAILRLSVFTIEPHHLVGGIVRDITEPSVQRSVVIEKAKDVVERHLATVQRIAFLLGENASETEILMKSIVDSFSPHLIKSVAGPEETP